MNNLGFNSDLTFLTEELLNKCYILNDNFIMPIIDDGSCHIKITNLISFSLLNKRHDIIRHLLKINFNFDNEPKTMMMCAEMDLDDLFVELLDYGVSIKWNNYACVHYLASKGKLDLLKSVINKTDGDVSELVAQIIVNGVIHNHLNIVKHFLPYQYFDTVPDFVYTYFINGIIYGGHLDIIKYFIEGGVCLAQDNYHAVRIALRYARGDIIRYFVSIDQSVIGMLDDKEKLQYGLMEFPTENKYIGSDQVCCIMKDTIKIFDNYFQCEKGFHVYGENIWKNWVNKSNSWKCPICQANVDQIIYVNKV